jgi:hypothetical protein
MSQLMHIFYHCYHPYHIYMDGIWMACFSVKGFISPPMPVDHGRTGYVAIASRPRCASGAAPRLPGKARRASKEETFLR